jgi:subtilisin-like proprotein convertase family protein
LTLSDLRERVGETASRTRGGKMIRRLGTVCVTACVGCCIFVGATASAATFSNPAPITIPDSGPASPYPSNITVSGLAPRLADVNVTLTGLTHAFPADLDILLSSPTGQTVVLMSDVPHDLPFCDDNVAGINLTFDDAANPIPAGTDLASGTYRPTNNDNLISGCGEISDSYPAPAPGPPYGSTLAGLSSGNPNGTWSLYVVDDDTSDSGSISGGWSLDLTPVTGQRAAALKKCKKKAHKKHWSKKRLKKCKRKARLLPV